MTVTVADLASKARSRYREPAFEFNGARIWAHCRHIATVVAIEGDVDATNVDKIREYAGLFILTKDRLVFDISEIEPITDEAISLVCGLVEDCRDAGVDWILVATDEVADQLRDYPVTHSVREAVNLYAEEVASRRQLMLPLIKKTA